MRCRLAFIALALIAPLLAVPTSAQEPPPPPLPAAQPPATAEPASVDEEARALLKKVAGAYDALKGISVKVDTVGQDGSKTIDAHLTIDAQVPSKFRVTSPRGTAVSDGDHLYLHIPTTAMRYRKIGVAGASDPGKFAIGQVRDRLPTARDTALVDILRGDPFFKELTSMPGVISLKRGGSETIDGIAVETVIAQAAVPGAEGLMKLTFYIGPDNLLRRIMAEGTMDGKSIRVTETHTVLAVNPTFAPNTFKFVPPPGVKEEPRPTEPPPGRQPTPKPKGSTKP
jgi:outer membrane lipoprotein-sorting protein